jgi:hypothetical protein
MKRMSITVNGVLRNLEYQFELMYRKAFIKNDSLIGMDENFQPVEEELSDEDLGVLEKKAQEKIIFPIDTLDLFNHFKFDSRQEFENFLYDDYNFQILAGAESYPKAFDYLFKIQWFGELSKMFDITLVSNEKSKGIASTYHFLAKKACRVKNVKFIDDYKSIWDFSDIVITDLPEILDSKPEGKISIKINKPYNQWNHSDFVFDDLKEASDKDFLILL